jgi:glucose dehydrogenase
VAAATTWTPSVSALAAAGAAGVLLCGCGARSAGDTWSLPNSDLAGTRAVASSAITAANVGRLRVRWRFRFTAKPGFSGIFASTPLADRRTVYVQDLRSTVFALDRSTGALRWTTRFDAPNDGPNGLALDSGRIFGATDSDAFALSASSGA